MPCMPHFHDHFIPSTWVVLRKQDNPPAAAAAAAPTGPQPCCRQAEAKLQQKFDRLLDAIIRALSPFCDAYQAVREAVAPLAAEELREQNHPGLQPSAA